MLFITNKGMKYLIAVYDNVEDYVAHDWTLIRSTEMISCILLLMCPLKQSKIVRSHLIVSNNLNFIFKNLSYIN
jgi:hypothetical protein